MALPDLAFQTLNEKSLNLINEYIDTFVLTTEKEPEIQYITKSKYYLSCQRLQMV